MYISKSNQLKYKFTWAEFRSLRAKISWTTNSRPDMSCFISKLVRVTETIFTKETKIYVQKFDINSIISHLLATSDITHKFPKLDKRFLKLTV